MMILKKLFFISFILAASIMQAILIEGINYQEYYSYIEKSNRELDNIVEQLQFEDHGNQDICRADQAFADIIYSHQKKALKKTVQELNEKAINSHNKGDDMLYNLFKHEIYYAWKKAFKNNYAESLKKNDLFAWAWINQPIALSIKE